MVRGTANLPAGLGKTIKTAVLCSAEEWEELQNLKIKVDYHLTDAKNKNVKFIRYSLIKNLFSLRSYLLLLGTYQR